MPSAQFPLTSDSSATDATSYTTASITPTANRYIEVDVLNTKAASPPTTPTLSGNGLTYVEVASVTFDTIASPLKRRTRFRSMGAAPTAGAITIDFGGVTQTGCIWSVKEFDSVDTTGTFGSGAHVQSATNSANTGTSLTVTLAAFGSTDNATTGGFGINDDVAINPGTGFTEIHDNVIATVPVCGQETEWRNDNDTSVDASASDAANKRWGGIASELKFAAAAAGHPAVRRHGLVRHGRPVEVGRGGVSVA